MDLKKVNWKKVTKVVTVVATIVATGGKMVGDNLPEKKEEQK